MAMSSPLPTRSATPANSLSGNHGLRKSLRTREGFAAQRATFGRTPLALGISLLEGADDRFGDAPVLRVAHQVVGQPDPLHQDRAVGTVGIAVVAAQVGITE